MQTWQPTSLRNEANKSLVINSTESLWITYSRAKAILQESTAIKLSRVGVGADRNDNGIGSGQPKLIQWRVSESAQLVSNHLVARIVGMEAISRNESLRAGILCAVSPNERQVNGRNGNVIGRSRGVDVIIRLVEVRQKRG